MNRSTLANLGFSLVSLIPLTFAACGGGGTSSGDCTATGGTNKAQYVVNSVQVPQQRSDYAIDLNGDGRVDNQLGNIIGALTGQGLDVQSGVDMAIGRRHAHPPHERDLDGHLLPDRQLRDGERATSASRCMMPDYSGMGHFTIDTRSRAAPSTDRSRRASSRRRRRRRPSRRSPSASCCRWSRARRRSAQGQRRAPAVHARRDGKITGGQLNGGIKASDVQMDIIPAVATILSNKLMNDNPQTSTDMQIASIFDNGGKADPACSAGTCKNPCTARAPACAPRRRTTSSTPAKSRRRA